MKLSAASVFVPRTCTQRFEQPTREESKPFSAYRDLPAYVLLGDSGAGKTEAFKREASETGGEYVTARDFITLGRGKNGVLFIDGLDEVRAGAGNGGVLLDKIRKRLKETGSQQFRLSCRAADWFGHADTKALQAVFPGQPVVVLTLDPLTDDDLVEILRRKGVAQPEDFMQKAAQHHLCELLHHPQNLNLLIEAVQKGDAWPASRAEIYEKACTVLLGESNREHRHSISPARRFTVERLLEAAGCLCAVSLLADVAGFALDEDAISDQYPHWHDLIQEDLPLQEALKTNIFQQNGEERRSPAHRSIAEYLGARYLAGLVKNRGLPFGRVLALMPDNAAWARSNLQGLIGWLAFHCCAERASIIRYDVVGVLLYGDVRQFSIADKKLILETLSSSQYEIYFMWHLSPQVFGVLATMEMEPIFREILTSRTRDNTMQRKVGFVLLALSGGSAMPTLAEVLARIIEDTSYSASIRKKATQVLTLLGTEKLIGTFSKERSRHQYQVMPGLQNATTLRPNSVKPERDPELQKQKKEWIAVVQDNLKLLRKGTAPSFILHGLAQVYNGQVPHAHASGETPEERLRDFFDGEQALVNAVYLGFRHVLDRKDLPTVAQIVELERQRRFHFLRAPCLIGVDRLYQEDPMAVLSLNEGLLAQLLAFRFTEDTGNEPQWLIRLVQERPQWVATVFLDYALPLVKAKQEHIRWLFRLLDGSGTYHEMARMALPALLQGFALRVSQSVLRNTLVPLMCKAITLLDKKESVAIVEQRLSKPSMDNAQRVLWLSFGFAINPTAYAAKLRAYIGKSQARAEHFHHFIVQTNLADRYESDEVTLGLLIEFLAPDCSPERVTSREGIYAIGSEALLVNLIYSWLDSLRNNPSQLASAELQRLLQLPTLLQWHAILQTTLQIQQAVQVQATFKRLSAKEISGTLANREPANAADLCALVLDYLQEVARKVRDANSDGYKLYWDSNKPKQEKACRHALLIFLEPRLNQLGIDAQPEAQYARETRADIRVSFREFSIPIEIKTEGHADLWKAMHQQLIPKYTRDPQCRGYGIYLVFWFGEKTIRDPGDAKLISSAQELEACLQKSLSTEEKRMIRICVINCARE